MEKLADSAVEVTVMEASALPTLQPNSPTVQQIPANPAHHNIAPTTSTNPTLPTTDHPYRHNRPNSPAISTKRNSNSPDPATIRTRPNSNTPANSNQATNRTRPNNPNSTYHTRPNSPALTTNRTRPNS